MKTVFRFSNVPVIVLFAVLFALSSCKYSKEPKVYADDKVSIQYPSYLFKSEDVYPMENTLLQLKNDYRDIYFILVDHGMKPGDQGFELMYDSITKVVMRSIKEPNIEARDTTFITANNLKVKEFMVSGVVSSEKQDHRFLYVLDMFETPDGHLYQTAGWLLRHKRNLWLKDLQQAAYSLKVK
jgi:hypothetical protein